MVKKEKQWVFGKQVRKNELWYKQHYDTKINYNYGMIKEKNGFINSKKKSSITR